MYKKKTHFFKELSKRTKRLFRARTIIIVSNHKLDHVPLSGTMQILLLVGVLGFFSGLSYLTGSYMNARSSIKEKDRTIARARVERANIGEEMALLKRDLGSFSRSSQELVSKTKMLSDSVTAQTYSWTTDPVASGNTMFNQGADKLSLRVSYLESRIKQMRDENDRMLLTIRERTGKKIDLFEDIIAMTGLNSDKLEAEATAKMSSQSNKNASSKGGKVLGEGNTTEKGSSVVAKKENSGGPFIESNASIDPELLSSIDRAVLLNSIVDQLPLSTPMRSYQLTSGFGRRADPFNGRLAIHPGLDFSGSANSPIMTTNDGKVVFAGRKAAYGNVVDVEHAFGIVTRYAHMSSIKVTEGQNVKKGDVVGTQGSTGRSTGAHLHYEVRINDHPVNPQKFLQAGEYVSEK